MLLSRVFAPAAAVFYLDEVVKLPLQRICCRCSWKEQQVKGKRRGEKLLANLEKAERGAPAPQPHCTEVDVAKLGTCREFCSALLPAPESGALSDSELPGQANPTNWAGNHLVLQVGLVFLSLVPGLQGWSW